MILEFMKKRSRQQIFTSIALPLVVVGGWFYPMLGFFLLLCMVGSLAIAWKNGRKWCDWSCPRGSFYDIFLKKISRRRTVPDLIRKTWFRSVVLGGLITALGTQLYFAWPDIEAVGMAFVRVLTITTTGGIVLGFFYQERAWCHICPMGTLGKWSAPRNRALLVSGQCKSCRLCTRVCPMQLKPYEYKAEAMHDGDCLKCGSCVAACPITALEFGGEQKRAA